NRREFGWNDRRRLRLAPVDPEDLGAGERAELCGRNAAPAQDCHRKEAQRRLHCGSSAGKMCTVLSQRRAPPPRWIAMALAAARIAIGSPMRIRVIESRPSSAP